VFKAQAQAMFKAQAQAMFKAQANTGDNKRVQAQAQAITGAGASEY